MKKNRKYLNIIALSVFYDMGMACDRSAIELDSLIGQSEMVLSANAHSIIVDSNYRYTAELKKVFCFKGRCPDKIEWVGNPFGCETVITSKGPYLLFLKWNGTKYVETSSWVGVWKESQMKISKKMEGYYAYTYPIAWVKITEPQIKVIKTGTNKKYGFDERVILARSLKSFLLKTK